MTGTRMTSAEHYREAMTILNDVTDAEGSAGDMSVEDYAIFASERAAAIGVAQVHATLANYVESPAIAYNQLTVSR